MQVRGIHYGTLPLCLAQAAQCQASRTQLTAAHLFPSYEVGASSLPGPHSPPPRRY